MEVLGKETKGDKAPVFFVPHGGGPLPILGDEGHEGLVKFLKNTASKYLDQPKVKAILIITPHWEEDQPHISSGSTHKLLYDYGGFPREAYNLKYPAPGSPELAQKVAHLLSKYGFSPQLDSKRGWDHGVFVPLLLLAPNATLPVVSLSILSSQSAEDHIKLGQALQPLREEGVAIVGSGMTFHNFKYFFGPKKVDNKPFERHLEEACLSKSEEERLEKLKKWREFEGSEVAQPKGEADHLQPLFVVAGAAGESQGKKVLNWEFRKTGIELSGYLFE